MTFSINLKIISFGEKWVLDSSIKKYHHTSKYSELEEIQTSNSMLAKLNITNKSILHTFWTDQHFGLHRIHTVKSPISFDLTYLHRSNVSGLVICKRRRKLCPRQERSYGY
jgi:hypothetical protein